MSAGSSSSSPTSRTIGMIGLGLMGTAMTERFLEHGYSVRIWNRSKDKADPLLPLGAVWSDNPLAECDRVIISLYTTPVVEEVLDQLKAGLHSGQTLIDTTTGEPEQSIALANRLAQLGVKYMDAPISGSSEQTRRGEATVLVGGGRETFDACADLWAIMGQRVFPVGAVGSAAKMKLVSNLVLGLNRAALAEALIYAESIGVDPAAALEVLKGSMAYSKVMDVKGRKMLDRDYSVQARLSQHLKDVVLILETARQQGVDLPMSTIHRQLLEEAERRGFGQQDNCSVIEAWRGQTKSQP
ncbi:MAG: NAD(P)-dependent oxidoreductase [Planctomycetaceae bacterium]